MLDLLVQALGPGALLVVGIIALWVVFVWAPKENKKINDSYNDEE